MSSHPTQQLLLQIHLDDSTTFESFYVSDENQQVVNYIQSIVENDSDQFVYLWGSGAGCSHLLQALCHQYHGKGLAAAYIPLTNVHQFTTDIFSNLEQLALVCVDDIQQITGTQEWENALFILYNNLRERGVKLVVAATTGPRNLSISLTDLASRLQWGISYQVQPLNDEGKICALQLRARLRGFNLSAQVGEYILQRNERNIASLFEVLNRLDRGSLETKRKVTVPLVKQVMGW